MKYDFIIVGGGIAGCSIAHHLSKEFKNVLLIDRNLSIAAGASGAAGAFLSPLLGKSNKFKDLVTKALTYSVNFYKKNAKELIINKGVLRVFKNQQDEEKFKSYIPYFDFKYELKENGYFFDIGSKVDSIKMCEFLSKDVEKRFNLEIEKIEFKDDIWILNNTIETKNLILATGADTTLISEDYFKIRPVWGQRIDVETTTKVPYNYHKECSISSSQKLPNNKYLVSIGATHNIYNCDHKICSYCLKIPNISNKPRFTSDNEVSKNDTQKLLKLSKDILDLKDINVLNIKIGARASSVDYFPMVGELINSQETLLKYPYIKKGSKVPSQNYIKYKNLYLLNGVGGRGFVLSPFLAKQLVDYIVSKKEIDSDIITNRLFQRWARRI
ncbi:MAG: FAD-binding oxidoreductase [Arcobacteraceae bacterium]|nr:FAD-binding oxidoreductase [Arcobacteraceae bacterium]